MYPLITYDNGIAIEGLEFRLDAAKSCECSFVSHAHSDHAHRHERIIATPETALIYRHKFPNVPSRVIPFNRKTKFGSASVELFPSGHMLGAAQILIEIKKTRIVYTGDFKSYPNFTCPPLETRKCDVLIMESTYGDPGYSFPPQNEVYTKIIAFVKRALTEKYTPVLVGYAMGKGQEAVFLLQQQGFTVCVDTSIAKMNQVYRAAGIKLGSTEHYLHADLADKVVVVTPQTLYRHEFKELRRKRSLFLSGWSLGGPGRRNFSTDAGVPLSDHADFSQLLAYIEASQPAKIFTLHGEPKFAQILREMGYDAEYVGKKSPIRNEKKIEEAPVPVETDQAIVGENFELFP